MLRRSSSRLILDLSKVTYCDPSALAVLVGTGRRARLLGGSLCLAAISPQVEEVLQTTGLHQALGLFATVRAAAASPDGPHNGNIDAAARSEGISSLRLIEVYRRKKGR